MLPRPALARIPGAGGALLGLASVRGAATPVYDLATLLGRPSGPNPPRLMVLVERLGPVGLLADAVDDLQPATADETDLVQLDDLLAAPTAPARMDGDGRRRGLEQAASARRAALTGFGIAGQRYALPLSAVRESVLLPPGPPANELSWRGVRLPLVRAGALLHPDAPAAERHALVLERPTGLAALAVDTLHGVIRLEASTLQPAPRRLRGRAVTHIAPDACGLTALLDVTALLEGAPAVEPPCAPTEEAAAGRRGVMLRIGSKSVAAWMDRVSGVERRAAFLARVPGAPAWLRGAAQRNGAATPVLDFTGAGRWTAFLRFGGVELGLDVDEPPRTFLADPQRRQVMAAPPFDARLEIGGESVPVFAAASPRLGDIAAALQAAPA